MRRRKADPPTQSLLYLALGELLRSASKDANLAGFLEVVEALSPALFVRAQGFVRPSRVPDLVAETWIGAWRNRHDYRLAPTAEEPLEWLHRQMCLAAQTLDSPGTSTNHVDGAATLPAGEIWQIEAAVMTDKLACTQSVADVEADLLAEEVDDLIDALDDTDGLLLRRRCALGEDWPRIAADLGYASPRVARRRCRRALARFAQLRDVPTPPALALAKGGPRQDQGPQ